MIVLYIECVTSVNSAVTKTSADAVQVSMVYDKISLLIRTCTWSALWWTAIERFSCRSICTWRLHDAAAVRRLMTLAAWRLRGHLITWSYVVNSDWSSIWYTSNVERIAAYGCNGALYTVFYGLYTRYISTYKTRLFCSSQNNRSLIDPTKAQTGTIDAVIEVTKVSKVIKIGQDPHSDEVVGLHANCFLHFSWIHSAGTKRSMNTENDYEWK
jgi:hypothetical protein